MLTTSSGSDRPRPAVAVVGAGAMGAGIAQVAAQAGHDVHLVDAREGAARAAVETLGATLRRLAGKGRVSDEDAESAAARLHPVDGDVTALPAVGLVVEAVVEDLEVKREIFAALAQTQAVDTVLASNTSSLDLTAVADGVPHPGRVIGLHFFNPPPLMRLVEVIRGRDSDRAVLDAAATLMRAWGKTPVECASTPGFIVNRVARPFYGEAQRMVADGTLDAASVDLALRAHAGFRMGPMELTDLIGQDVNLAVGTSVWEQTGHDPRYAPTDFQRELVATGRLGRKSGRGVFTYDESGTAVDAVADPDLVARLVGGPVETDPVARTLAMLVNEGVDLVHRGEASAEDVDTAMRLGTNYPQGPFAWRDALGSQTVVDWLTALDSAFPGGRYRLSPGLTEPA
ncbi:3-hydroxyacyl-CoA dehydrogenase NAD-binding domain-containing protein [Ornithinimicrobium sediminis]|uniref:3-hydroxyacyl-CoA dehydrogenase NAD-binding domain-containing protein n=1 Tax=Ornithinimicrobium sediminis TaxID=2904603 RepID=UPI001E4E5D8A|nr:3-hydroxyacyl-CoA dehydrogenase NAD-binding domain-containing protein [Ornithinimicrobium sediminis]MCE0486763.1 3-hydroxyacyl-CoA dehydrogenase NAD-binding domain-containing protein [Ornithinimicrobium sediminis]